MRWHEMIHQISTLIKNKILVKYPTLGRNPDRTSWLGNSSRQMRHLKTCLNSRLCLLRFSSLTKDRLQSAHWWNFLCMNWCTTRVSGRSKSLSQTLHLKAWPAVASDDISPSDVMVSFLEFADSLDFLESPFSSAKE